ncbi:hypothetical protein SLEP1_g27427 [Rubroshorea leprosula]|uniref:Uncharacterized protein n=1 Tax=Rubroshorea leprosula TaxID=152421 RepID=A0AAV5JQE3_9ROSI|nr:hypothetical protein SLEP1_g27427 [Rubroshorea leprosula]
MSFYLLPKQVIYELDKIRRKFLWGGVEEGRKIAWVSWDRVCCSKKEGGLGIKNLRWFNMALLGKWWARLAVEGDKGLWSRVLLEKYGGKEGNWLSWLREGRGLGSSWWNDVCKLNRGLDGKDEWLFSNFKLNLGDGKSVRFWNDAWAGGDTLANIFPRLFLLATEKNCSIYDMGHWVDGCWFWRFQWRRRLRAWEEDKLKQLTEAIQHIKPTQDKKDNWSWRLHGEGKYTTRSAYEQLVKKEDNRLMEYRKLRSAQVPSKVCPIWKLAAKLFSFSETRFASPFYLFIFFFGLLGDDDDDGGDGDGKQRDLWFYPSPSISMVIEDGDGGGGCDDDEMQGDGLDLQKGDESREKKRWVLGEPRPREREKKKGGVWVLQENLDWVLREEPRLGSPGEPRPGFS